jgi:hypothetical protein
MVRGLQAVIIGPSLLQLPATKAVPATETSGDRRASAAQRLPPAGAAGLRGLERGLRAAVRGEMRFDVARRHGHRRAGPNAGSAQQGKRAKEDSPDDRTESI